jgi:hypothetical protein
MPADDKKTASKPSTPAKTESKPASKFFPPKSDKSEAKSTPAKSDAKPSASKSDVQKPEDVPHGAPPNRVTVTQYNRRDDNDLLEGQFVKITDGKHQGRWGAYVKPTAFDGKTGYPSEILVQTQDDEHELLVVPVGQAEHKASPR